MFKQGSPQRDGDSLGLGGDYIVGNNLECSSKVVPVQLETAWGWVVRITGATMTYDGNPFLQPDASNIEHCHIITHTECTHKMNRQALT